MNLFGKNLDSDVVYVAEIGINHEGSCKAAENLIKLATDAGADAVKLQTYTPERYASASDPARLERVRSFALDENSLRKLAEVALDVGVPLFSTPLSDDVVPLLDELFGAIKIASGDLDFEPVIRTSARTGKPILLSTGCGDLEEIDTAVNWIREEVGEDRLSESLVLFQCTSAYPAPIDQANINVIPELKKRYGVPVGYSNHVIGPNACLAAIAHGASVMEVHFTDQKTGREFRDHELSMEPADLTALIEAGNQIKQSLGSSAKCVQECEAASQQIMRKGVVASQDLRAGHILTREDLMFARPATNFPASEIGTLIGRKLGQPLRAGELMTNDSAD